MYGEFIYDSSVVLAQVFINSRFKNRVKKIQKNCQNLSIPYKITPFVIGECTKKIRYVGGYVTRTVRDLHQRVMSIKDPNNQNPNLKLAESDAPIFMSYFSQAAANLAAYGSDTEKEILEYVETWIIDTFEDDIASAHFIDARNFFRKCTTEATTLYSNWLALLARETSNQVPVTAPASSIATLSSSLSAIRNQDDIRVLAEAIEYRRTNSKVVFVSLDYKEIVRNAPLIERVTQLRVADPLYALVSLRTLPP